MSSKKNFIYNVVYNILGVIIPLITAPYLARVLGTEGTGVYSYYHAIAYYFTLLAKIGLTNYGTRRIAEVKNDAALLKKTFAEIFIMQLVVGTIVSVTYFLVVFLTFGENAIIGYVFGVWIVATVFNIDWFLFGLEQFKITATRSMIIKIVNLALVFVVVRNANDVWKYCLLFSVCTAINYALFWQIGKNYIYKGKIKFADVIQHIKPCFILMIPVIALNIYRSLDKVMLGKLSDMDQTGLYENAEKIIYSLTLFISSLGQVMMPKMAAKYSNGKSDEVKKDVETSLIFVTFMTSGMCFGVLSISSTLIPWFYGDEFIGSTILINLLAVTLILIGWGNVMRTQLIIPSRRDDIYIKSISLGALLNVIFNAILIPKYQAVGACIGTIVAEVSVPLYQAFALRKEIDHKKVIKRFSPFIVFGFIMCAILKSFEYFVDKSVITMIFEIIIGACIYILLSYIYTKKTNPEIIKKILKIKNKQQNS